MFFSSNRGGDLNLWKIPASGGETIQITKQGGFESFAAPDGKIVFYTRSQGAVGLWQTPIDGGAETLVAELSEAGYKRYWAATQNGIYFVPRTELPPYKIKFYDFSTAQIKDAAATDKPPIWTYPGLSASADGKTILYAQSNQNASSIMLAEFPKQNE